MASEPHNPAVIERKRNRSTFQSDWGRELRDPKNEEQYRDFWGRVKKRRIYNRAFAFLLMSTNELFEDGVEKSAVFSRALRRLPNNDFRNEMVQAINKYSKERSVARLAITYKPWYPLPKPEADTPKSLHDLIDIELMTEEDERALKARKMTELGQHTTAVFTWPNLALRQRAEAFMDLYQDCIPWVMIESHINDLARWNVQAALKEKEMAEERAANEKRRLEEINRPILLAVQKETARKKLEAKIRARSIALDRESLRVLEMQTAKIEREAKEKARIEAQERETLLAFECLSPKKVEDAKKAKFNKEIDGIVRGLRRRYGKRTLCSAFARLSIKVEGDKP